MRTVLVPTNNNTLASLCIITGSEEPSLFDYAISTKMTCVLWSLHVRTFVQVVIFDCAYRTYRPQKHFPTTTFRLKIFSEQQKFCIQYTLGILCHSTLWLDGMEWGLWSICNACSVYSFSIFYKGVKFFKKIYIIGEVNSIRCLTHLTELHSTEEV